MSAKGRGGRESWGEVWIAGVVEPRGYDAIKVSRARAAASRGVVESFEIEPASVGGVIMSRGGLERRW